MKTSIVSKDGLSEYVGQVLGRKILKNVLVVFTARTLPLKLKIEINS
jgi:hypothetical protein